MSRKSATIFGKGTIPEPSTSHIGKGVALVAQTAAFVYIYARIPQIAEMTLSFHATDVVPFTASDELLFVMVGYTGGDGRGTVNDVLDAFGSFGARAFCEDVWNSDKGDASVYISLIST